MASLISLSTGFGPTAEPVPALPSDAQASVDGLADSLFTPVEPPPVPLPEWIEPAPVLDEARVDPQQWLIAMLDQQAVQLQARGFSEARADAPVPGFERLLSRMPVQTGAVVLAQENLNPAEQGVPTDTLRQGAQETFAPPPQSRAAGLLAALPQADPATARAGSGSGSDGMPLASLGLSASATAPLATPLATTPGTGAAQEPVLERGLTLAAPQARWGEQMLHALRETVQVQVQQRFQQATIRLDPPELGSLEIFITQEPGRLSVQISAAQADVARLLQHTSDRLRQELVEQITLQVNVQISSDAQGHGGRDPSRQPREPEIVEAVHDAHDVPHSKQRRTSDVLVTV